MNLQSNNDTGLCWDTSFPLAQVFPDGTNAPFVKSKQQSTFNAHAYLESAGVSKRILQCKTKQNIYSEGDAAHSVMYVRMGGVKLSVVNESGKEAVVAMFGPGDFFGEACIAGQRTRLRTATAITPTDLLIIEKGAFLRLLHAEQEFSDFFITHILARNFQAEENLIDQFFNSCEKRLARALLLLARHGARDQTQRTLPKVSQEMLAEMVGTTRSRINQFMNKFRKLGFIDYDEEIRINRSLLTVVLDD
jgi:CRP/FNR family transcriptional regulator, cyclic AMP receptor protein